jgi:hypothetical protein
MDMKILQCYGIKQYAQTEKLQQIGKKKKIKKERKKENMHTDRCSNTHRQKCRAKGRGKEAKV